MKINKLIHEAYYENDQEAEEKSNDIINWAKVNLKDFYSSKFEFEIDEKFVIHTPEVILTKPIKKFPYPITDTNLVNIFDVDVLESFDNFPTVGVNDSFSIVFDGKNRTSIDFSKLPEFTDADFLELLFFKVSNISTKQLQHVHYNIDKLMFTLCESPDLYDFDKYVLYVSDCEISPTKRFKNLSSFLKKEIVCESFRIQITRGSKVYKFDEVAALNNIFIKYNGEHEQVMDFSLELIDAGFEDEL